MKQYWKGYRMAKNDVFECGLDYAISRMYYGSMSDSVYRGYSAYVRKIQLKSVGA